MRGFGVALIVWLSSVALGAFRYYLYLSSNPAATSQYLGRAVEQTRSATEIRALELYSNLVYTVVLITSTDQPDLDLASLSTDCTTRLSPTRQWRAAQRERTQLQSIVRIRREDETVHVTGVSGQSFVLGPL